MEMARDFAAFRTRLLGAWIITNVVYVTIILHYNFLLEYGMAIAVLIFWTLFFRMTGTLCRGWSCFCSVYPFTIVGVAVRHAGSIVYQLERIVKWVWSKLCCWCCIKCCWERHRGADVVHDHKQGDSNPDYSDGGDSDGDEDRWGYVDCDNDPDPTKVIWNKV